MKPWLRYILEEFLRIQSSRFNIDDIPQAFIEDKKDKLWEAFRYLSRLEECKAGWSNKSNYSFSYRIDKKRDWTNPVVNQIFLGLEKDLGSEFANLKFDKGEKPKLYFSHDIDYLTKTLQLYIKQGFFYMLNSAKLLRSLKLKSAFMNLTKAMQFFISDGDYLQLERWQEIEKEADIYSTFYVFSKIAPRYFKYSRVKKWLIDPAYDVRKEKILKDALQILLERGNKLGLHASYYSAGNLDFMKKEKENLQDICGLEIKTVRQHWLNYYEGITPGIHEKCGFETDSSVGFNDTLGFRAGVASRYRPFNHAEQRPYNFYEIPFVIMDSHFSDYNLDCSMTANDKLQRIFDILKGFKNIFISIDWHQRSFSNDRNRMQPYLLAMQFHGRYRQSSEVG